MEGSIFGKRAGRALKALFPEQHRDKAIARFFGCTVRMARYLQAGEYWSRERLDYASRALGVEFDRFLVPRDEPIVQKETIEARLARIEDQLDELIAEARRLREAENESSENNPTASVRLVR
jgi:hypothetical protein